MFSIDHTDTLPTGFQSALRAGTPILMVRGPHTGRRGVVTASQPSNGFWLVGLDTSDGTIEAITFWARSEHIAHVLTDTTGSAHFAKWALKTFEKDVHKLGWVAVQLLRDAACQNDVDITSLQDAWRRLVYGTCYAY